MIYFLFGKLILKKPQFAVIDVNGVGYKVFIPSNIERKIKIGAKINLFCSYHIRQEMPEIYGFLSEKELDIFELLNSINGIGPKSALKIVSNIKMEKLTAAINKNRADVLAENWGIGKKKAEKIIFELKDKIKNNLSEEEIALHDLDKDIKSALKNLGYKQSEINEALKEIPVKLKKTEERIKFAIKRMK
ncbi:MAG: Holliday junction branch migration protein RuvA [Patescibacteria group bacterium]|nr:Holliday junction branch migration protein RuvA [Patescibacteria group bacterium]